MIRQLSATLLTISTSVALPLLFPAPSSAITVIIDSIEYDVDYAFRAYDEPGIAVNFQLPPAGRMPWFEPSGNLASTFAQQVYDQLGLRTLPDYGPVFAYDMTTTDIIGLIQSVTDISSQIDPYTVSKQTIANYAFVRTIRPLPTSVPAPLPLLGAAAAFGWSRKLRKRLGTVNIHDPSPMS